MTSKSPSEELTSYLNGVVKDAREIDKSKFIRFHYTDGDGIENEAFVYLQQLKRKSTGKYFHGNLASLLYVAKELEKAKGLKLELPNTHAIKGIVVSPETKAFRDSNPKFSLISDLIVKRTTDGDEVRKVEDISFDDIDASLSNEAVVKQESIFLSEKIKSGNVLGTRFFSPRVLSRETIPWIVGCFKDFRGPIPSDLYRGEERDGVWQGYRIDKNNLSCVKGTSGEPIAPLCLSAEPCETTKSAFTYYTEEDPHK
jgi:hypothetical protein